MLVLCSPTLDGHNIKIMIIFTFVTCFLPYITCFIIITVFNILSIKKAETIDRVTLSILQFQLLLTVWAYLWSYTCCTNFGDSLQFVAATILLQNTLNSTWWLDLKFSNVLFHSSHFEKEPPASILAAILTTRVLFAGKMEAWCVGSTILPHQVRPSDHRCSRQLDGWRWGSTDWLIRF